MSFLPPSDYTLTKLLGENKTTSIWLAEQVSVRRNVVLEQLSEQNPYTREEFLASVRAKAAVDHPLIASVYEAVNDKDHCFFTREWLPGENLAERIARGGTMRPGQIAHLLKRIAEANIHLEERATATTPLKLSHIYLDEQNVLRISNLALAGARSEQASQVDIQELGAAFPNLVENGVSGATRLLTLLHWMSGDDPSHVVQWPDIRHYADQIEQQLATPVAPVPSSRYAKVPLNSATRKVEKKFPIGLVISGVAVVAAIIVAMNLSKPTVVEPVKLNAPIEVPDGSYAGPDGNQVTLRKFWLSAYEVTIGDYAEFLQALDILSTDQRKAYEHEDQPVEKVTHEPDGWIVLWAAAQKSKPWEGRMLTKNSPMFGVDWWDAHTYSEWKRARLPTQEEWFAAMKLKTTNPLTLRPTAWGDVQSEDQTPAGLFGMAGGVSEWIRKPSVDPSNPLGARQWVIIGASYAKPANGVMAREWTNDRNIKRPDLGFRIAFDHLPE